MAYAYTAIDDMMGNNAQKQNIFNQGQAPGANPNDVTSGQGQAAQAQEGAKTSTEGDLGTNAPGSASAGTAPRAPVVKDSGGTAASKSTQAAFKANVGKTNTPSALTDIEGRIGTAQSGLQKQAQDYAAQQAASHNYALDQGTAQKAVEQGDTTAKGSVLGLLGKGIADQVDTFKPTNVEVKDIDLLNNNAGIKQLVSRGRSPTYNAGMAAFDAGLLQANPNFQKQVSNLKSQGGALQQSVTDTSAKAQADAEAAAQANLTTSQDDIRNYLLGYQSNIKSAEQQAADAANAGLPAQIAAAKQQAESQLLASQKQRAQDALNASFGTGRANEQLNAINVDPSQYISYLNEYKPEDLITQEQAGRFNNINELLGQGGQAQAASMGKPELYSTNADALYNSLVGQATQARQTKDVDVQKQIAAIQAQAQQAAAADNARRLSLTNNYGSDVSKQANQYLNTALTNIPGLGSGLAGSVMTPEMQGFFNKTIQDYIAANPANYKSMGNPLLQGQETYTKQQADQLNALARDLGQGENYTAGQYAQGGPQSLINSQKLNSTLNSAITAYQAQKAQQDAAARDAAMRAQIDETVSKLFGGTQPGQLKKTTLDRVIESHPISQIRI